MIRKPALFIATLLFLGLAGSAVAAPPPWAHAHGWRAQHYYPHYYYENEPNVIVVAPAPPVVYVPVAHQPMPRFVGEPVREFQNERGQYCREYQTQVKVGGQIRNSYGTACEQPDGEWEVVN